MACRFFATIFLFLIPSSIFSMDPERGMKSKYAVPEFCVVCLDSPPTTITLPCQHVNFCNDCAELIKKRHNKCSICRENFSEIRPLRSDNVDISAANKIRNSVPNTDKETFIQRADLRIERIGYDLVISGNAVDKFNLSSSVSDEIIKYYLGTTQYNPNMVNTRSEFTGMKITFKDGQMKTTEGISKHTYPGFFKFVRPEVVGECKLREHMLNHYYFDYVLHISK